MKTTQTKLRLPDPLAVVEKFWPDVYLYDKQRALLYSLWNNDETVCPAGNMLGKDFIAALGILIFFQTRKPCRAVTTSVKDDHLVVLWGEMLNFIRTSKYPMRVEDGGNLIVNHRHIRKIVKDEATGKMIECDKSYIKGFVAEKGAAYQGHHIAQTGDGIPRTLLAVDEASGVEDDCYEMGSTWANRIFIIGNPWQCSNFFYRAVEGNADGSDLGGDISRPGGGFYRKVISIAATDSPNVRLAMKEIESGKEPSHTVLVPGVKTYAEYLKNLRLWDDKKQCVALRGQFYKGADVMLIPAAWLELAMEIARKHNQTGPQLRRRLINPSLGVDSAMGGDNTSWAGGDLAGLTFLEMSKTPNTAKITGNTLAIAQSLCVADRSILFDAGGGGQVHADRLREQGHDVRSIAFGEGVTPMPRSYMTSTDERIEQREEKYVYKNRRAELYGLLRERLDPISQEKHPFGLPRELLYKPRPDGGPTLYKQLSVIPLWYDEEGRLYLPPKQRKPDAKDDKKPTMNKLLGGYSPDEADALVLMHYGLVNAGIRRAAG